MKLLAIPALRAMRAATREDLDRSRHFPHSFAFMVELERLRALFGLQLAYLAIDYGINLDDDLAALLPPELRGEIDD